MVRRAKEDKHAKQTTRHVIHIFRAHTFMAGSRLSVYVVGVAFVIFVCTVFYAICMALRDTTDAAGDVPTKLGVQCTSGVKRADRARARARMA